MTIFATLLAVIGLLTTAAWVYMAFFRGGYWKTDVKLTAKARLKGHWPRVAVIVPARNEAGMLQETLPSLLKQDYHGTFHIYLVDDGSDDGTAATAAHLAEYSGMSDRLTVVKASPTPEGWAGKVWAMQQGLTSTTGFRARYLLLTDADIVHPVDSLRKLVSKAVDEELDTVSVMAKMKTVSGWEKFLMPAFVYFFSMLYPFRWVNDPDLPTAAAAGGCLLVRRAALEQAGGFKGISGKLIDDCSLARAVRDSGGRTWLGYSEEVNSARRYESPSEIWNMVSRSAYEQLKHSWLLLAGTVIGLGFLFAAPLVVTLIGVALVVADWPGNMASWTALIGGAVALEIMSNTYSPVLRMHGLGRERGLTLPLAAVIYLLMTLDSARRHHAGTAISWRGRPVRSAQDEKLITEPTKATVKDT